jgi:hypothetical protein
MHEQIEAAQSFNVARLLPNTASFLENHFGERGKSSHATFFGQSPLTAERSHIACDRSRILAFN